MSTAGLGSKKRTLGRRFLDCRSTKNNLLEWCDLLKLAATVYLLNDCISFRVFSFNLMAFVRGSFTVLLGDDDLISSVLPLPKLACKLHILLTTQLSFDYNLRRYVEPFLKISSNAGRKGHGNSIFDSQGYTKARGQHHPLCRVPM